MSCAWTSCKETSFQTRGDLLEHQQEHCQILLQLAEVDSQFDCNWPRCESKRRKQGQSLAALRKHLKQHVKTHCCSLCNTVFARKSDLQRHIQTKHSEGHSHFCPFEDCDRSIEGYPRKDKLDEHIKKMHLTFQCILDHCDFKVIESDKQSHFDKWHSGKCSGSQHLYYKDGMYECNFSGCQASKSQFNDLSASRHLINHHKSSNAGTVYAVERARSAGRVAARGDSFVLQPGSKTKNRPCTYCVKAKPSTRMNEESPNPVARSTDVTNRHSADLIN